MNSLRSRGSIDQVAIHGATDGGSKWAADPGIQVQGSRVANLRAWLTPSQLSGPEIKSIIDGFNDSGKLYSDGIHVAGVRYVCIRADSDRLVGKKVGYGR